MGEIVKMEKKNPINNITVYKILKIININVDGFLKDNIVVTVDMKDNKGNRVRKDLPYTNLLTAQELKKGDEIELMEVNDIKEAQDFVKGLK